jgi:hypothetical protein
VRPGKLPQPFKKNFKKKKNTLLAPVEKQESMRKFCRNFTENNLFYNKE